MPKVRFTNTPRSARISSPKGAVEIRKSGKFRPPRKGKTLFGVVKRAVRGKKK
jgi:hypothetical protein